MTVKDLMTKLQECDPDKEVEIGGVDSATGQGYVSLNPAGKVVEYGDKVVIARLI